jgi:hypothetical protein
MTNGMISISADSIRKSLFNIRSVINSIQSTNKQVNVAGVSTISFTGGSLQVTIFSMPVQPAINPVLFDVFHTSS